jgi:L-ascorbate metabolism protein UlaG (beta-lactamase superfamily)
MLSVRRLNLDNSWQIKWDEVVFLIDPWLSGVEIDGFSWFNEQWHATAPVAYERVDDFDLIVISQGYPDHCHLETLQKLGNTQPIAAVPAAFKKLNKKLPNPLYPIPPINQPGLEMGPLKIFRIIQNKPVANFNAVVIQKGNEYILHAPHGGPFASESLKMLEGISCICLITTFTLYQLPFFLGGKINPGKQEAEKLIQQIAPRFILNTHDEDKPAKGISNKLAKRVYPDFKKNMPDRYISINHYHPVELI